MPVNLGFYTQPSTRCCSFRHATLFTFLSTLFPEAPREKAPLKQRGKSRHSTLSNLANRAPHGGAANGRRPEARPGARPAGELRQPRVGHTEAWQVPGAAHRECGRQAEQQSREGRQEKVRSDRAHAHSRWSATNTAALTHTASVQCEAWPTTPRTWWEGAVRT